MKEADEKRCLKHIVRNIHVNIPIAVIADAVASHFEVIERDIFLRNRKLDMLKIRYMFMALAKDLNPEISYYYIGHYCQINHDIPFYNHVTIINACIESQNFYDSNSSYRNSYNSLKRGLLNIIQENSLEFKKANRAKSSLIMNLAKCNTVGDLEKLLSNPSLFM